jgi:hypothetical protein
MHRVSPREEFAAMSIYNVAACAVLAYAGTPMGCTA